MKLLEDGDSRSPETPSTFDLPEAGRGRAAPVPGATNGSRLNFLSAPFNRIDDLSDNYGNYRSFQTLEGVITADMRHQMERRISGDGEAPVVAETVSQLPAPEGRKIMAGEEEGPLTVVSQGRILIIATEEKRAETLARRLGRQGLTCRSLLIRDGGPGRPKGPEAEAAVVSGVFGEFTARITIRGEPKNLAEGPDGRAAVFDLVLDLQPVPSYGGESLPLGYYAFPPGSVGLEKALTELPEMRGRFEKPRFTAFMKSRCRHGRSRTRDCRRCLEVCPFGAIRSVDREISFSPQRCQGCGGCALVCPAAAVRLVQPPEEELRGRLHRLLENRPGGLPMPSALVISEPGSAGFLDRPDWMLLELEPISRVRPGMLLAALACGVEEVLVVPGPRSPSRIRTAVDEQIRLAGALLRGLGLAEHKIRLVDPFPENGAAPDGSGPAAIKPPAPSQPIPQGSLFSDPDPRTLVRRAVQRLYDRSPGLDPALPLPADAPFGAVIVKAGACTLCLACTGACPSGALSAAGDRPRLLFQESRCHQCGLCREACPEDALRLLPRLLCAPAAVESPVVLQEAEPFCCVECGKPFAPPAMISRLQQKLDGHWMYRDERQRRRLQMCPTCRTRDALTAGDLQRGNPS